MRQSSASLYGFVSLTALTLVLGLPACSPSTSQGAEFAVEPLVAPSLPGSGESHLAVASDGTIVMSWLEPEGDGHALRFATLHASGWSPASTVARGERWFVNWADFPSVVPISDTLWAAHWLSRQPAGGYAYDVVVSLSTDGGRTWGEPFHPHRDGTATEHGFVSLFPWQDSVGAVWLDGREMAAAGAEDVAGHAQGAGGMTLRSAVLRPDGASSQEFVVDGLTCDCCQTDVAVTSAGPIVAYRDRTTAEIRDIMVVHARDDGWGEPIPVSDDGWRIEGCPVNGPAVDGMGETVVVAWFTAASDHPRVRLARSGDGGRSFSAPLDVDQETPLGRVDAVLAPDGDAIVLWLRPEEGDAAVVLRRVGANGELGPLRRVAKTAASRLSGFPQMVLSGQHLVISWTVTDGGTSTVQSARVAIDGV